MQILIRWLLLHHFRWVNRSLPKTLWREISTEQISTETFTKKGIKILAKTNNEKHTQKYLNRNLSQKSVKIYQKLPNYIWRKLSTKQSVKGNSLPNKLWKEISSKQIPPTKTLERHFPAKKLEETSQQTKTFEETFSTKKLKRTISQKNPWREISTILCREIPTKQILEETSTKEEQCLQKDPGTNLYEKISEEKSLTKIQRNISTKKKNWWNSMKDVFF